ncbi:MAG: hypothetical protein ABIU05_23470 [Nitrospirales bacterium]
MLCLILPLGIWAYWPAPFQFMATQLYGDFKWGLGAALVPAGFFASSYMLETDLLSPHGSRKVLLEWPDYWMIKNRVVMAVVFCGSAVIVVFLALYLIAESKSSLGAAFLLSGWLSAFAALGSVGLARWKIREILGE